MYWGGNVTAALITDGPNIALGKAVSQSHNSGTGSLAVDGFRQMNSILNVCADTGTVTDPSWSVNWGSNKVIHRITITGRGDVKGEFIELPSEVENT